MDEMVWIGLAAVLLVGVGGFVRSQLALKKAAQEKEAAAKALPDDQVQCFSCGMVVAKEKALEKKGRYFCGVKRNDRHGHPIQPDSAATAKGEDGR